MPKCIIDDYLYDIIQENCPEISPKIIPFSSGLQSPELDKKCVILTDEDLFYISLKEIKLDHVSYCGDMSDEKINEIEEMFNNVNEIFFSIRNELLLFQQLSITIPLFDPLKENKTYNIESNRIDEIKEFSQSFVDQYQLKIDEYLTLSNKIFSYIFDNVKHGVLGERVYE